MEAKQAINLLKHHLNTWQGKFASPHFKACELAIKVLENQISAKPYKIDGWHCGKCKKRIYTTSQKPIYCPQCGNLIDWD